MGRGQEWGGEKGLSSNGTQSQQLLELLLLQLESHPSRTTKHVIFGQTMHDTQSHTHTHTHRYPYRHSMFCVCICIAWHCALSWRLAVRVQLRLQLQLRLRWLLFSCLLQLLCFSLSRAVPLVTKSRTLCPLSSPLPSAPASPPSSSLYHFLHFLRQHTKLHFTA